MFDPIALEVLLTPRKKVLVDAPNQSLDVMLRLRAHESKDQEMKKTPLAISIVIDRSGSMDGGKLDQAKRSVLDIIHRLQDHDLVSVISYNNSVEVHLELMPVPSARILVEHHLWNLFPRGGTNLHEGWLKGAGILAPVSNSNRLCRVILLSDGQANDGITRTNLICNQVTEIARAGISTTTVGFGLDFNEELMTAMANAGQGNAWFGERIEDLQESFDSELSYLSNLVFKDVEVIAHYAGRTLHMRNDYLSTRKNTWKISGIAVGSEKWMAFSMPMQEVIDLQLSGPILEIELRVIDHQDQEHTLFAKLLDLPVVSLEEYLESPEDELVAQRFQEVEMADIQREARRLVQEGNWTGVERMMDDLENRARNNPWVLESIKYIRKLLEKKDRARLEKELMYSARAMKNREASLENDLLFCMDLELSKPVFMRKKVSHGRNSDSQS